MAIENYNIRPKVAFDEDYFVKKCNEENLKYLKDSLQYFTSLWHEELPELLDENLKFSGSDFEYFEDGRIVDVEHEGVQVCEMTALTVIHKLFEFLEEKTENV